VVLLACGLLALPAGRADAGFTISLGSVAPSGPNFVFNYTASIPAPDQIVSGDFFRIYDFSGLVGTPTVPTGWTASVANSNPTPPPNVILSHGDDPAIPNLTFTYTAATPITGPVVLPGFSAVSSLDGTSVKDFAGRDTAATAGSKVDSVGDVSVPRITPTAVPEPAGIVSLGLGVIFLEALLLRRSRRKRA
jgi:hypothetical protein